MLKRLIVLGLFSVLWAACGKGEDSAPAGQPVEAPATPVAPAGEDPAEAAAGPEGSQDGESAVPTAVDFEDEASAEITADNLESELGKLEKEIGE